MKASTQTLVFTALVVFGPAQTSFAQAPPLTVKVTASDVPIPLVVVRGTQVQFEGPISEQMMPTTVALRNDYGEFTRGSFLDSWKLAWNTGAERDPAAQIAVLWSRGGAKFSRLTRYNVRFVASPPFAIKSENVNSTLIVRISPTGTLTAQKYLISLDGAETPLEISSSGKGVIDVSLFSIGRHTLGATAVMTDGSVFVISPVPFSVSRSPVSAHPPAKTVPHKPTPPSAAKHKSARRTKKRRP